MTLSRILFHNVLLSPRRERVVWSMVCYLLDDRELSDEDIDITAHDPDRP